MQVRILYPPLMDNDDDMFMILLIVCGVLVGAVLGHMVAMMLVY